MKSKAPIQIENMHGQVANTIHNDGPISFTGPIKGIQTKEEILKGRVPGDAYGQIDELRRKLSDDELDRILKDELLIWSHANQSLVVTRWARLIPWYAWAQVAVLTGMLALFLVALWYSMRSSNAITLAKLLERGLLVGFMLLCAGAMAILLRSFIAPQRTARRAEAILGGSVR